MSERCANCGSYAFNLWRENIEQGGLCDRHYWQERAEQAEAERDELKLELIGAQSESDARQILLKQVQQERDELKARVEELEAFLDWTEKDEDWDKSWKQIMSEWKEVGE